MHATTRPPCPLLAPGLRASLQGTRFVARPTVGAIGGCCGFGLQENTKRRGVGTFQKPFTLPHLERLTGACDVVSAVFDAALTPFIPLEHKCCAGTSRNADLWRAASNFAVLPVVWDLSTRSSRRDPRPDGGFQNREFSVCSREGFGCRSPGRLWQLWSTMLPNR